MKYAAFISYSRADATVSKWLLRRLETYRVPRRLVGTQGAHGVIEERLGTFFRDREELAAAGDLGVVVREALSHSEALIVICSIAAAQSRWVNAEIEAFQDLGRPARVYCFIVGGKPGMEDAAETCFPHALITRDAVGNIHEPMAADARPAGDGRERAFTKLVAGLLGIDYDLLVRREAQRRIRAIGIVAAVSFMGMIAALALAAVAVLARNDATRRQAAAEDMMGFMVDDLRGKLTTVGRLDLMRSVDDKATRYYATLDSRDLSDRALEEQARLLTGIGQVRTDEGQHDAALNAFQEAYARTRALYDRSPGSGQRLFDLAQAEYWVGWVAFQQARYDDAQYWLSLYRTSAVRLAAMDRSNFAWQKEVAYGNQNLAILDEKLGRYAAAEVGIKEQLALYRQWLLERPNDVALRYEETNAASWLSTLSLSQGHLRQALDYASEAVDGLNANIAADPANMEWLADIVDAYLVYADAQTQTGRRRDALASTDRAVADALALTTHDPTNNGWRVSLGNAIWRQAVLANSPAEADERAHAAVQLLDAARRAEPKSELIIRSLVRARNTLASIILARGEIGAVNRYMAESLDAVDPLWERAPSEDLRLLLARAWLIEGDAAMQNHDMPTALAWWIRARDLLQQPALGVAPLPFVRLELLIAALDRVGDTASAVPHRQRLDEAGFVPLEPITSGVSTTSGGRIVVAERVSDGHTKDMSSPRKKISGKLDILACAAKPKDKYFVAKDPHGNPIAYCYRFTGGTDGYGGIEVSKKHDGDSDYKIVLTGDSDYRIQSLQLYDKPEKKVPIHIGPKEVFDYKVDPDKRGLTIHDLIRTHNAPESDFFYRIFVVDTRSGAIIDCDPTIHNKQLL